jgi:hypothetical protein
MYNIKIESKYGNVPYFVIYLDFAGYCAYTRNGGYNPTLFIETSF